MGIKRGYKWVRTIYEKGDTVEIYGIEEKENLGKYNDKQTRSEFKSKKMMFIHRIGNKNKERKTKPIIAKLMKKKSGRNYKKGENHSSIKMIINPRCT